MTHPKGESHDLTALPPRVNHDSLLPMPISRREFVGGLAGLVILRNRRDGSVILSDSTESKAPRLKLGYAAITWGANDLLAMTEISDLGFAGIQLRNNVVPRFVGNPASLTDFLEQKKLTFVALSSGSVSIDPDSEARMIAEHVARAKFLHACGGLVLQVTDERPAGREVTPADCEALGKLLTKIGQKMADEGLRPVLAYHPHMGTIGQSPENADRVLAAADPARVKLLLDIAHYQQGGGDPVATIRKYRDRLAALHLKDVETVTEAPGYRFVELGRGRVDLPAVFKALDETGYDGWAIVELDSVPDPSRTPKQSAEISRAYLATRM